MEMKKFDYSSFPSLIKLISSPESVKKSSKCHSSVQKVCLRRLKIILRIVCNANPLRHKKLDTFCALRLQFVLFELNLVNFSIKSFVTVVIQLISQFSCDRNKTLKQNFEFLRIKTFLLKKT